MSESALDRAYDRTCDRTQVFIGRGELGATRDATSIEATPLFVGLPFNAEEAARATQLITESLTPALAKASSPREVGRLMRGAIQQALIMGALAERIDREESAKCDV